MALACPGERAHTLPTFRPSVHQSPWLSAPSSSLGEGATSSRGIPDPTRPTRARGCAHMLSVSGGPGLRRSQRPRAFPQPVSQSCTLGGGCEMWTTVFLPISGMNKPHTSPRVGSATPLIHPLGSL